MEPLDAVEVRAIGALIEKEATTPDYYPLSLNALVNACNQRSNREPVVDYTEDDVSEAILRLRDKGLAAAITGGGRVTKYGQRISETLNLGRRELAILCTLLLRGPQTLGEIKDRSERMHAFADLAETERVLEKLAEWPGGS
ncbi:MAG: YceH family protein, partial [Bryobacteraceae bacterium]